MMNDFEHPHDRQKILKQLDTIDQRFNQINNTVNHEISSSSDTFSTYLHALSDALDELKALDSVRA
jgi:hypothetical protein